MPEPSTFFSAADWILRLSRSYRSLRKRHRDELDRIASDFTSPDLLTRYFIEPECQQLNPADEDERDATSSVRSKVSVTLGRFFDGDIMIQDGRSQMFVFADAGMGKTSLLVCLHLSYLKRFMPLGVRCQLLKLGPSTLAEIAAIQSKRRTILLLDSLDEDRSSWGCLSRRIEDLLNATRSFRRVVITCRTQYFPEDEDQSPGRVKLGGYTCPAIFLSYWDNEQVTEYLVKRFRRRWKDWLLLQPNPKLEVAKEKVLSFHSLESRPMLLAYIEDIVNQSNTLDTDYELYEALVASWLDREERKFYKLEKPQITREVLAQACELLAETLYSEGRHHLSQEDFVQLCHDSDVEDSLSELEIGGRSLLNRTSGGSFRFAHYSIEEFLAARCLLTRSPTMRTRGRPSSKLFKSFIVGGLAKAVAEGDAPELVDLDLRHAQFKGLDLQRCRLIHCDLSHASFQAATLTRASLVESQLNDGDFRKAELILADLTGADLRGADLSKADLSGAILRGADLTHAKLEGTTLQGAVLDGADLSGATLVGAQAQDSSLKGVRLRGAKLERSDLSGCDLSSGEEIPPSDLSEARLDRARLVGARLVGARLEGVSARQTDFSDADLSGADFTDGDLRDAKFFRAQVTETRFPPNSGPSSDGK